MAQVYQLDRIRELTRYIKGEIRYSPQEGTLTLTLTSRDEYAQRIIPGLLEDLVQGLSNELYTTLMITGELIEKKHEG